MSAAQVRVAVDEQCAQVLVSGRATFACSPAVRRFAAAMLERNIPNFMIDLSECDTMDSTFMGVLAMIGTGARERHINAEIVNASDYHKELLDTLGIDTLFSFSHTPNGSQVDWRALCHAEADADSPLVQAEVMRDAHQMLMDVDEENIPKFRDVVRYIDEDIDRLKQSS